MVATLEPDLVRLRRNLHRHPELGFAEHRTASLVAERMRSIGAEVRTGVGGTGVLADLRGDRSGPTLLVRADMDALPITETTGLDFASAAPAMHACGHDAHVSAAVGAATVLAERRADFAGTVRFCFQPAEETLAGAERMIADGAMKGVDCVLGVHVHTAAPVGVVLAMPGPVLAGGDFFQLEVRGRAGHGGMPHLSVDAVYVGCQVVNGLQAIVSRETRPGEALVVSTTSFDAASAPNVARESVTLRGNIRWFSETQRDRALGRIQAISESIAAAYGAEVSFVLLASAPVSSNDPAVLESVLEAIAATGRATAINPGPITASDDWARYREHTPGAFVLVGAGAEGAPPHHHPRFAIDEGVIGLMTEVLAGSALRLLHAGEPLARRPECKRICQRSLKVRCGGD